MNTMSQLMGFARGDSFDVNPFITLMGRVIDATGWRVSQWRDDRVTIDYIHDGAIVPIGFTRKPDAAMISAIGDHIVRDHAILPEVEAFFAAGNRKFQGTYLLRIVPCENGFSYAISTALPYVVLTAEHLINVIPEVCRNIQLADLGIRRIAAAHVAGA